MGYNNREFVTIVTFLLATRVHFQNGGNSQQRKSLNPQKQLIFSGKSEEKWVNQI